MTDSLSSLSKLRSRELSLRTKVQNQISAAVVEISLEEKIPVLSFGIKIDCEIETQSRESRADTSLEQAKRVSLVQHLPKSAESS